MKKIIIKCKDKGKALPNYGDKIYCICYKCKSPAIIEGEPTYRIQKAKLICIKCAYVKEWSGKDWYGPKEGFIRKRCNTCGYKWLMGRKMIDYDRCTIKQTITLYCDICKSSSEEKLTWQPIYFSNKPTEPYFGLDLYLQQECCGNILWAYNEQHLEDLKAYIEADIRERVYNSSTYSILAMLPKWLIQAKHRNEILKAINKLENKLQEI